METFASTFDGVNNEDSYSGPPLEDREFVVKENADTKPKKPRKPKDQVAEMMSYTKFPTEKKPVFSTRFVTLANGEKVDTQKLNWQELTDLKYIMQLEKNYEKEVKATPNYLEEDVLQPVTS